jgi:nicotinamide riboside kinase
MRIAISGVHNSGKTTLMKALVDKYPTPIITGVAHAYTKTSRTCLETQHDILKSIIKKEKSMNSFIHDRSVFDCLAYFAYRYSQITPNYITAGIYGKYLGTFVDYIQSNPYDLVIYIDDILPITDTTVRDGLENQQYVYDYLGRVVPLYATQFGVPVITVRGSTTTRMKKINTRIKNLYQQKRVGDFDKP